MRNLLGFLKNMMVFSQVENAIHPRSFPHREREALPFSPLSWERGLKRLSAPEASKKSRGGFTLIELVITVAIVGLLAMVALPMAELGVQRFKEHELHYALREIRTALDTYKRGVDEGWIEHTMGKSGYPPSLKALVEGVTDARVPDGKSKIYFLRQIPRDPMFPDQAAPDDETWGKRSYESSHDAPEEGEDVFDVYSLSPGVGLNGIAYRNW